MWLITSLKSSVLRKQIMGITGLIWYIFLGIHVLGNFGLLYGPQRFNWYVYLLTNILAEITIPCEVFILCCLCTHVTIAITLLYQNFKARSVPYYCKKQPSSVKGFAGSTIASRTMIYGGVALGCFLFLHVAQFKFGYRTPELTIVIQSLQMRDLYSVVLGCFAHGIFTGGYIISFIILGLHLWHGVESSLQSAGFNHPLYQPGIRILSRVYACLISGSFIFLALWGWVQGGCRL